MIPIRRKSRQVWVGDVPVGGAAPIAVQSMTDTDTRDIAGTDAQIRRLADAGAHIVRVAVPDFEAVDALESLVSRTPVPLVADIHFDHRLALGAIQAGVHKIRINPGNLGHRDQVEAVLRAAAAAEIPIRLGVNGGSLPRDLLQTHGHGPEAMVQAALRQLHWTEAVGFHNVVVSLKASDVPLTVSANEQFSRVTDYPIHLGVTEAGLPGRGTVKSAVGLGYLLGRGIGDTLRVSLTGDPVAEVGAARDILSAWHLASSGPELISCPTCGRCQVDLTSIASQVEAALTQCSGDIRVAVMGCEVNGPGEARHADVGLACGSGSGVVMYRGEIVGRVQEHEMVDRLMQLVHRFLAEQEASISAPSVPEGASDCRRCGKDDQGG